MLRDTWLLLTLRWQVSWNGFMRRSIGARIGSAIGALAIAGLVAMGSASLGVGIGLILRQFPDEGLAVLLPGGLLTAVTLLLLLTSFGVALGSLFLASDLDLLMSAPVDRRAVFISKLLDGMLPSYIILLVAAAPALLAFGLGLGFGPLYYLMAVVALVVIPLLPAGLGALLVMLVARVAPARRVREFLGLMGALFGIACGVLSNTSRLWVEDLAPGRPDAESFLQGLRGWADLPIPPLMAARGLVAAGTGEWGVMFVSFGAFLLTTLGFFALCVWVAESLYAAGWVRMQSSGSSKRSAQRAARAARNGGMLRKAPAWLAVVLKDWRVIPRDLRNFAQMLAPLVLLPVVIYNMLSTEGRRNPINGLNGFGNGVDPTGIFIAGGVMLATLFVFGRVAETSISMEAKSWWLLKAAPVSPIELLFGKFMSAAVPYAILSSLLMAAAALWRHFHVGWFLYGWLGVELLGLGLLAVSIGLSVPWAKLDWDDPRRMLSWQTSIVTLVAWVVLGLLAGIFLCLPALADMINPALTLPMMVLGPVVAAALLGGAAYGTLRYGIAKVADVGEG